MFLGDGLIVWLWMLWRVVMFEEEGELQFLCRFYIRFYCL